MDYCAVLDVAPVLGPDEESNYQLLIGVMKEMDKIKSLDIKTKVSTLPSF